MKIEKICLRNFRQYKGQNEIDLSVQPGKNIILIGGKNGYGKTNFLLSLVWCLYGEEMSKIDETFKREVQKDGNYVKFMRSSLNWDAAKAGETAFSVELTFSDIQLPEPFNTTNNKNCICVVKREFQSVNLNDELTVDIIGNTDSLFSTFEDKVNFINDYLIPLEAAKFVFFDAENIASWAELSTKEEGSIFNDALSKILGLDLYESLIDDLGIYVDGLRKENATAQVGQQIITSERGIDLNKERIEEIEREILSKDTEIQKLKSDVVKYVSFIKTVDGRTPPNISLDELEARRKFLVTKIKDAESRFTEIAEIMPFALAAGKLEETVLHLEDQENTDTLKEQRETLIKKTSEVIERLFNAPPFPEDGDITLAKKMFYADKVKKIVDDIFGQADENTELSFEHEFNKNERDLILETFNVVSKQSVELFEQIINGLYLAKEEFAENERAIKKAESDLEDEEIIEYTNKRSEAERKIDKLSEEKGALINQKETIKKENERLAQNLHILLKKITVSKQKAQKIEKANVYREALEEFVLMQKSKRCRDLEEVIFKEMKVLMHKLTDSEHGAFLAAVKAETLPDNDGIRITLYDKDGISIAKESLSQGEKQIYISSLVKAILSLSIQDYPIFIDTPLGRLDDEHIRKILTYYYPELAEQVVIMATNNEIPPSRFKLMAGNISRAYLLEYERNQTKFKPGYFKSYEN